MSEPVSSSLPRPVPRARVRTLFLSDLHLGARASRPQEVLEFLCEHDAEQIYLVGDILDVWHGGPVHAREAAEALIAELGRRAAEGTRITYLVGNHDAPLRRLPTVIPHWARKAGWEICDAVYHESADGRRFLVLHGDQCDSRLMRWQGLTRIGSRTDAALRRFDDWLGQKFFTREPDRRTPIQRSISFVSGFFVMAGRYENRLLAMARAGKADGVICGHSHKPMLLDVEGTIFANCGDWIDSFTALTESHDGALRLVKWVRDEPQVAPSSAPAPTGALAAEH
ncbi:UDP-2,3-diacylglucosamine diphosphatase [Pseudoroseicyclus sp. H15]